MVATQLSVRSVSSVAYPVVVGPGVLEDALPRFLGGEKYSSVAVITNETVAPLYGEALAERLPDAFLISVPDGEQYKTLETVQAIYDALLAHRADRSTIIIALGGGVIGDMVGFVAATYMRGLRLIQAPTSLLAMVDASIGGKVGVDLPQGKNLVGAFKDPIAVFSDTSTLKTLSPIEFRNGMAEVIKSGLIAAPELLTYGRNEPVEPLIERAARAKIGIVEQDRLEQGVRAYLNLGHTFGHAIEQASGYQWKHGAAVAVGLVAAARLSVRLGLCAESLIGEVEEALRRWELPTRYRSFTPQTLWKAMQHDKKWRGGTPRFVLLEDKGKPLIRENVPPEDVLATLEEIREGV